MAQVDKDPIILHIWANTILISDIWKVLWHKHDFISVWITPVTEQAPLWILPLNIVDVVTPVETDTLI